MKAIVNLIAVLVSLFWMGLKVFFLFGSLYFMWVEGFTIINLLMFIAGSRLAVSSPEARMALFKEATNG